MHSKGKKRKIVDTTSEPKQTGEFVQDNQDALLVPPSHEDVRNSGKGILSFPVELRTEILEKFLKITMFTETPHDDPILPRKYYERTNALRALSQVCVAYRREFLPVLWEQLNICCDVRGIVPGASVLFHVNVGKALERNCDGLAVNPHLRPYIRTANVVLTRYKAANSIPKFRGLLHSLENLHTLYFLHTHTQLGKFLNQTFEDGVTFPNIRTLAIQGYCHHFLRCCPNLTTLWCVRDDGAKLLSTIQRYCKNIEEIRGFSGDEKIIVALIKAAPNLRTFEVWDTNYTSFLQNLHSFKKFNKLVIKTSSTYIDEYIHLDDHTTGYLKRATASSNGRSLAKQCITDFKAGFECLPPQTEKRRIFLLHAVVDKLTRRWPPNHDTSIHPDRSSGMHFEVDLDKV